MRAATRTKIARCAHTRHNGGVPGGDNPAPQPATARAGAGSEFPTGAAEPPDSAMAKTPAAPESFEAALRELETIVATMEGGQLPLAESLAAYRRGAELLQYCQSALKDAQMQVEVLEKGVLKGFEAAGAESGAADEP